MHDILEQTVDRSGDPAQFEDVEHDQQAEQPDQQADDLAQRFTQRLAAAGPALEEIDGVDEFGKGPFGCARDEPGDQQRDEGQKDFLPQFHRQLFVETIAVENHETVSPLGSVAAGLTCVPRIHKAVWRVQWKSCHARLGA